MKDLFANHISRFDNNFSKSIIRKFTLKNIFYRIINIIVFSFLMSIYTYIPFLVYMNHYGFFSYDLFNNGLFAINIISFYVVFFLITFSLMFSLGIGIAFTYSLNKEYKMPKWNWYIIIFNLVIVLVFVIFIYSKFDFTENTFNRITWLFFLLFVSVPICIHLSLTFTIFSSIKSQLISTFISFCIILPISFFSIFEGPTSKLTSIAFEIFSIGGKISIEIKDKSTNSTYDGKLIFLSPDNIYFYDKKDETKKYILERKDKEIMFYDYSFHN